MKDTLFTKITLVIAGIIITLFIIIFLLSCFTEPTVSQEKKYTEKKVSVADAPKTITGELLLIKVTHVTVHYERTNYPPYIKQVIDSVYIREDN